MYQSKTFLAIIPARGGSKGIHRKNIKKLAGKPLIAWTIEAAQKSKYLDRIILSSEDDEIIKVAKRFGCEVPFVRPFELAMDDTPGIDPVIHAINTLKQKYDYVMLLQPTSPLRNNKHIDKAIQLIIEEKRKSLVSIALTKKSPFWMFNISDNNCLTPILEKPSGVRRQDLPLTFELNGAIYISDVKHLLEKKSFINKETIPFIMEREFSIDIDDSSDWDTTEKLMIK